MRKNIRLGEVLIEDKIISEEQLEKALNIQKKEGKRLGAVLIQNSMVTEFQMLNALAKRLNLRFEPNINALIEVDAAKYVSETLVKKHQIVPLYVKEGIFHIATADPLDYLGIDDITMASGLEVVVCLAPENDIKEAIEKLYAKANTQQVLENISTEYKDYSSKTFSLEDFDQVNDKIDSSPVVQLVNSMIREAIQVNASDIHIEPLPTQTRVRFRVDGSLYDHTILKNNVHELLITRIKILCGLNIAEKRIPQDGGFAIEFTNGKVDMRVSTLPTIYGEKVVIRLLGSDKNINYDLDSLGLSNANYARLKKALYNSNGIILMTGPTGSGKTTTSYSILQKIASPRMNVVSIEDPVEKQFTNINQIQVNDRVGLTFANGLRSILRQDPDIIMVGEIRDEETANIAIRSAITGHLVLSTLHTNDSISTIPRLEDMKIESYLIAASLRCVIAQRLVKKICPHCKHERALSDDEKKILKCDITTVYESDGCDYCNGTGYKGRMAIHEVLLINSDIARMISSHENIDKIKAIAKLNGMSTLRDEAIVLLRDGITNFEEVIRLVYSVE